jgi:hypothetical protein
VTGSHVLDLFSIVIGLVLGGLAVAVVIETMGRGRQTVFETQKLTSAWRLSELNDPIIVAREIVDVDVPSGARVLASGLVPPAVQQHCRVQEVNDVRAEFAMDGDAKRAFVFVGGMRPGALALITIDEGLLGRLEAEYKRLGDRAGEYVERFKIRDLGTRQGVVVETEGHAQDVLPWQGRYMIRLEDAGSIIGVAVDKDPSELVSKRLRVKGRLEKDRTGYPIIEALDLRIIG